MKVKRTKLYVFDFDNTLLKTPFPDEGKKKWEIFYNKKFPYRGWWSKEESLDKDVFPEIELISTVIERYWEIVKGTNDGIVILLTSRQPSLRNHVFHYLKKYNLRFHEYLFKWFGKDKPERIEQMLSKYKDINYVEIWDDRDKEIELYKKWSNGKHNLEIKINKVEI